MILIFGGAYQGKADFAKRTFGLEDEDIFYCGESSGQKGLAQESGEFPALSPQAEGARAIHGLEKAFANKGDDPYAHLNKFICNEPDIPKKSHNGNYIFQEITIFFQKGLLCLRFSGMRSRQGQMEEVMLRQADPLRQRPGTANRFKQQ